jgi:hypothetical protein
MAKTVDRSWMDTSEAKIVSGEPDIDARPRYRSWEMQPLGPIRPFTQDAAPQHRARDELHIHLHMGGGEGEEEEPYEMEGEPEEMEGEYEEGEGEYEEPEQSVEEMCQRIQEIGELAVAMTGSADTRRRQHTRDSRSVPTPPSEISYLSGQEHLSAGERRRMVADGAELLRQKNIAERAYLSDFSDALSDHWDRKLEEEKRNRR